MKKLLFIITLFITTISAQVLENSVPMNLSFQGVLSSSDGTIYEDGEYDLTFRIMFPSLQGVEINIWQETQSVFVANGLFSTVLGSIEELPAIIPGNAELEDQVGEELDPARITDHPAGSPLPFGYSLSVFSPPGFPGVELNE